MIDRPTSDEHAEAADDSKLVGSDIEFFNGSPRRVLRVVNKFLP